MVVAFEDLYFLTYITVYFIYTYYYWTLFIVLITADWKGVMVVLIDNVVNIARRKHDLLFYEQTGKKHVTIIYSSGSKIDMSITENHTASDRTQQYLCELLGSGRLKVNNYTSTL